MFDLGTLVGAVVGFVFTNASTTVIEKATEATLEKINSLRKKVVEKLNLKPKARAELEKDKDIDLATIKFYLESAIREDDQFAEEIKALVDEINQDLEAEGQGANVMYVYGGKGYQQNQNQGEIYNADTININPK